MSNVDLIIKHLSGEMNQEDAQSFEKDLESNPALKQEYEDVSVAFRLIKDQLQKQDEDAFRKKLLAAMEEPASGVQGKRYRHRPKWYFLVPLAASLAILLAVYLMNQGSDRILSRFYHPEDDPLVLAYNQGTRGETDPGIVLYHRGYYRESLEKVSELMERDPENRLALLYYLLASMELNLQEDALEKAKKISGSTADQLGQSLIWYTTLALIKSGHSEDAARQLEPLAEHPGPYQKDARRLQKMLLK